MSQHLPFSEVQALPRLKKACQSLGVTLDDSQYASLLDYLALLHRWNRTYNLTAIRDVDKMLVQHLFDSLSVVPTFQAELVSRETSVVLDIGSGAGLPGVVISIVMPNIQVICVDAVEKKTAFIQHAASMLKLGNLKAVHGRIEAIEKVNCDIAVSRAFSSLDDFVSLAGRHVKVGGSILAMKGKLPDDEIAAMQQTAWKITSIDSLQVPELDAQRCLVHFRRTQEEA
ncbi:16S rRNA (guanine(527)-N(7))-methyltransferase RsmG [Corticimicrobacter populi]|uniref:Ribosomal RNA small subunit methyltransferase G n=1 Tax=Corticimicrobacter populi TaxID=2175229 RepID=A0A2V1JTU2_9BURK|nr:16S rRNA (guanine(527)-N(7))-methyltransferase RsmG [Corticimicrobacter populi]PWF21294.1 16S rRNA (guanine(527)-N(7))-methyltransferase RsmG [Corticimicrobacter populi]